MKKHAMLAILITLGIVVVVFAAVTLFAWAYNGADQTLSEVLSDHVCLWPYTQVP